MIGREASAAARRYQLTLTSLTDAATQNEAALEQWSQQRSSNLAAYESEKAAVEHFNATHKGTSGTTKTVYQTVTTGKVKNTTSTTVTIPGEPAQTKPIPPRPEDPPKVTVTLVAQRGQLKRLAVDLRKIQQGLGAVSVDAPFDASLEDATTAVSVLQERVGEARAALGQLVSKGGRRGDVIVAKRLETLSLQGIGESIQKLREDLQAAVARANLDAAILKWATKYAGRRTRSGRSRSACWLRFCSGASRAQPFSSRRPLLQVRGPMAGIGPWSGRIRTPICMAFGSRRTRTTSGPTSLRPTTPLCSPLPRAPSAGPVRRKLLRCHAEHRRRCRRRSQDRRGTVLLRSLRPSSRPWAWDREGGPGFRRSDSRLRERLVLQRRAGIPCPFWHPPRLRAADRRDHEGGSLCVERQLRLRGSDRFPEEQRGSSGGATPSAPSSGDRSHTVHLDRARHVGQHGPAVSGRDQAEQGEGRRRRSRAM